MTIALQIDGTPVRGLESLATINLVSGAGAAISANYVRPARRLELRLKGPSVTPGYWKAPDKTAECFDEEGFYRIGDALKFADPTDTQQSSMIITLQ